MKVGELIERPQKLPQHLDVVVSMSPDDAPGYLQDASEPTVEKAGSYEYVIVGHA